MEKIIKMFGPTPFDVWDAVTEPVGFEDLEHEQKTSWLGFLLSSMIHKGDPNIFADEWSALMPDMSFNESIDVRLHFTVDLFVDVLKRIQEGKGRPRMIKGSTLRCHELLRENNPARLKKFIIDIDEDNEPLVDEWIVVDKNRRLASTEISRGPYREPVKEKVNERDMVIDLGTERIVAGDIIKVLQGLNRRRLNITYERRYIGRKKYYRFNISSGGFGYDDEQYAHICINYRHLLYKL